MTLPHTLPRPAATTAPRLFLTRIDDDFDPKCDQVLGPWCFIDRHDIFPEWEEMQFCSPFDSNEELVAAHADCLTLFQVKISELAKRMNTKHGHEYGLAYWWIVLSPWLGSLILATWRRWAYLESFIRRNVGAPFHVRVLKNPGAVFWRHSDTTQFMHDLRRSGPFDFWLSSLCLSRMAPAEWILEPTTNSTLEAPKPPGQPFRPTRFRALLRKLKGRKPFWDVPGISRLEALAFSLYVSLLPKKNSSPAFHGKEMTHFPPRFTSAFLDVLDIAIELTGLENHGPKFAEMDKRAKELSYKSGRLFVTGATIYNDKNNFIFAHAAQAGEKIVRVQHGSNYGTMDPNFLPEILEYMPTTAFFSWGWRKSGPHKGRFIPVPAPHFSRWRHRHQGGGKNLILVGTALTLNPDRFYRDINYVPQYRKNKVRFIKNLEPVVREDFLYRPYSNQVVDMDDVEYIKQCLPDVDILEGPLNSHLLDCRLLVMDHPGTTLNFALSANVPTICFWHPEEWKICPDARNHFEALEKSGILFPSPDAAAEKVNAVFKDVESWWNSDELQEARRFWVESHARTRPFWWWDWMKALREI